MVELQVVDDGRRCDGKDEQARSQWAKMATSTMNGMYVTRETAAIARQRIRHVLASVVDEKGVTIIDQHVGNAEVRITNRVRPVGRRV